MLVVDMLEKIVLKLLESLVKPNKLWAYVVSLICAFVVLRKVSLDLLAEQWPGIQWGDWHLALIYLAVIVSCGLLIHWLVKDFFMYQAPDSQENRESRRDRK